MKKLILSEDDFYNCPGQGSTLRGGSRRLYDAELVVKILRNGSYEVLKDRFGLSKEEIEREIFQPDERLLLMA
jgi:hypothetical protein